MALNLKLKPKTDPNFQPKKTKVKVLVSGDGGQTEKEYILLQVTEDGDNFALYPTDHINGTHPLFSFKVAGDVPVSDGLTITYAKFYSLDPKDVDVVLEGTGTSEDKYMLKGLKKSPKLKQGTVTHLRNVTYGSTKIVPVLGTSESSRYAYIGSCGGYNIAVRIRESNSYSIRVEQAANADEFLSPTVAHKLYSLLHLTDHTGYWSCHFSGTPEDLDRIYYMLSGLSDYELPPCDRKKIEALSK